MASTPVAAGIAKDEAGTDEKDVASTQSQPNWRVIPNASTVTPWSSSAAIHPPWDDSQYRSSLDLYNALTSCTDSYVAPLIADALHTLGNAYRLYGPRSVVGSYNGGKDAVVILHLMRAAHAKHYHDLMESDGLKGESEAMTTIRPRVIYFEHEDEFPEVLSLLHNTVSEYDLDMVAFERGVKFGEGLKILVETNEDSTDARPHPMAFVLGTRTSDPNAGSQGKFAPSSHYMPPFLRVNPILDWSYGHVWHFLRLFQLPYCSLYDEGYTSLGTVKDTSPCPALAIPGSPERYWPAYMLRDWDQERAGRATKGKEKVKGGKKKVSADKLSLSASSSVVSLATNATGGTEASKVEGKASRSASDADDVSKTSQPELKGETAARINGTTSKPVETTDSIDDEDDSTNSITTTSTPKTVGLLIIGDEILKGLTPDTNTFSAATALRERNVPLTRVAVVSDDHDEIVDEIRRMERLVDVIITSGGVGPTHDDVTLKSVSTALGREMVLHEEMAELLLEKMAPDDSDDARATGVETKRRLSEAQIKMATLPSSAKLRYISKNSDSDDTDSAGNNKSNEWPILQCRNVFVLPGVPQFFEAKIENLASYLSTELERSETFRVVLSVDEPGIVPVLNKVVENHPNVAIGSYPFVDHPDCKTVVTLEGRRDSVAGSRGLSAFATEYRPSLVFTKEEMDVSVKAALADLVAGLPTGSLLRVDNDDDLAIGC